jgi:hypothetical protein
MDRKWGNCERLASRIVMEAPGSGVQLILTRGQSAQQNNTIIKGFS